MISSALIVFREVLEAAIVLGILFASTLTLPRERRSVWHGIILGICGASFFAYFMAELENSFDNEGEFIFNAVILILASGLISWSVIWMQQQGRNIKENVKKIGDAVASGSTSATALLLISLSVVMREGSEAVFFLMGVSETVNNQSYPLITGALSGFITGVGVAYIIYKGLVKIPLHYLFQTVSILLMMVAAGMASEAAANLILIDKLPALIETVWDTSALLPEESVTGSFLHVLIGYDDSPSGMQILFFIASLSLTSLASYKVSYQSPQREALKA